MPTSKQLRLRMTRRMTGVISRKSYMRWLTLHCFACAEDREVLLDLNSELPTAATAQASSALQQRPSLHISVHSTTRVKCLSFIESTVVGTQGLPLQFENTTVTTTRLILFNFTSPTILSRQNQATFLQPKESGNNFEPSESESDKVSRAIRII
jgi:hypothetical protein